MSATFERVKWGLHPVKKVHGLCQIVMGLDASWNRHLKGATRHDCDCTVRGEQLKMHTEISEDHRGRATPLILRSVKGTELVPGGPTWRSCLKVMNCSFRLS